MTFEDEVQKIYGKFIWILDDFRININHINDLYKDFIKNETINTANLLKKSLDPKIKKKFFKKKSKQNNSYLIKPYNRAEEIKELSNNTRYSDLEKVLCIEKLEYSKKYMKEFIENVYLYGTQSDFLYRSSFIYVITLYEGFNDKIFELLETYKPEWFISKKSKKKIKYNSNIDVLTTNYRKRYKIFDLETEFTLYKDLKYYYYLRNILVHNLGVIDKKFTEIFGNHKEDIDNKIEVSKDIFNQLVDILILYFMFIKKTLIKRKDLILN